MQIKIKHLFLTLIVLYSFLPLSFAQDSSPTVRIIYFLPRDREPQPDISENLDRLIKKVQQAYADQMEVHGFGRKTFRLETDTTGKAVVHHIVSQFRTLYYRNLNSSDLFDRVLEEINERFDTQKNIYLTVIDISTSSGDPGVPSCGVATNRGSTGGMALIPASGQCLDNDFDVWLTAHELGHTFGLMHDRREKGNWIQTLHTNDSMITSFCAAHWLDVHRAFNPGRSTLNIDEPSTIKMLPPSLASPPNAIRFRFEITDLDGFHQVQLIRGHDLLGYKQFNGTSGTVEFVTTNLTLENQSLSVQVIDVNGNLTREDFSIDVKRLLPPPKVISIPDPNLAAAVRGEIGNIITTHTISNLEYLELRDFLRPGGPITNLTGLEHAYNLRALALNNFLSNKNLHNRISDLSPLSGLTKLKTLLLQNNSLTDVSALASMTQLSVLDISRNAITDISPLANLTQLVQLQLTLSGKNLSDISALASMTQLSVLDISGSAITDISPLAGLTYLRRLYLSTNAITDISPLAGLTYLRRLYLSTNAITDVSPLVGLTRLRVLRLEGNTIADVSPLVDLQELTELHVRWNPLSFVSINTHIRAMQAKGIEVTFDNRASPALLKISGNGQESLPGEELPKPFVVEAIDAHGKPLQGKSVTFAVTAGGGRLNATTATTDANGRAQTIFTLGHSATKHTIRVRAQGIWSSVTFTVYTAAGPPMYWIDKNNGTLHSSLGNTVENLVPSVRNATSLLVDVAEGKLYWTEQTSNTTGKIQRAKLDGSNVQLVKDLTSVPRGIAIDATNGKLYLTNSWGKIQRLNFDGSGFEPNFITGLDSPMSIAIDMAGDKLYWTEQTSNITGKIQRAKLDGSNVQLVKDLTGMPRGMVIDTTNGKLYLTDSQGKIQRLNFDGSGFESNFITGLDSPMGIAIDVAGGKLYWTEVDRIRCANLSGKNIQNVLTGVGAPANFVLGVSSNIGPAAPMKALPTTNQSASPTQANLLANYPNPFNPETWVPYQLAVPSEVTLHIYSVNGRLVRTLTLGHQAAGMYHDKSRAAYWDGRNEHGERVANGVYFYTITAGDFTATRKMLILK